MDYEFSWMEFYEKFADALLVYKNDQKKLIEKLHRVYEKANLKFPKLEADGRELKEIDPFTVFTLFNQPFTEQHRKQIIERIKEEFEIQAKSPVSFEGIPLMPSLNAVFYRFGDDRKADDIPALWKMFEAALHYADKPDADARKKVAEAFDKAQKIANIKWNLTMALFWIRPRFYLSLDGCNREFFKNSDEADQKLKSIISKLKAVPDGETYLHICDLCRQAVSSSLYPYSSIASLSDYAFVLEKQKEEHEKEEFAVLAMLHFLQVTGSFSQPVAFKQIYEKHNAQFPETGQVKDRRNLLYQACGCLTESGYLHKEGNLYQIEKDIDPQSLTDELCRVLWDKYRKKDTEIKMENRKNYWLYSPGDGASRWEEFYAKGIMALKWDNLGDFSQFQNRQEVTDALCRYYGKPGGYKNDSYAIWQFVNEMQPGDIVFAKRGNIGIVGKGIIETDMEYDPDAPEGCKNSRKIKWTHKGEWKSNGLFHGKTLTNVSDYKDDLSGYPSFAAKLEALVNGEDINRNGQESCLKAPVFESYTKEDFLKEAFLTEEEYEELAALLEYKKNIILQGAPGTGKTFIARRLAWSLIGSQDGSFVDFVQFHQSYAYEDFIMGFKPDEAGFSLQTGVFYDFCKKAQSDPEHRYYFIIDEINRGSLSRIFGELFMLMESDKRGKGNAIRLVYTKEEFYIPENLYIIGMMNTADRSLALLDYALRRRFGFFDLHPAFETQQFQKYQAGLHNEKFNRLVKAVVELNHEIENDEMLGEGFEIGHSYFCGLSKETCTDRKLNTIVRFEIIPMLKEYWFEEKDKVDDWTKNLKRALQ